MPILGLGAHVLIAIFFAVHAVRSGQDRYWLYILFLFPLLGSLVYLLAIWLPEQRHSRQGRALVRGVRDLIDPGRELREAEQALEDSPSTSNRLRLADALLAAGHASQAVVHYDHALSGVHAHTPAIEVRLAQALLESGQAAKARAVLEALIAREPSFRSPQGHLIYARALAACGERAQAREEFEAVVSGHAGLEARAHYAQVLASWGETGPANALCQDSLKLAGRLPRHARQLNATWIEQLKQVQVSVTASG